MCFGTMAWTQHSREPLPSQCPLAAPSPSPAFGGSLEFSAGLGEDGGTSTGPPPPPPRSQPHLGCCLPPISDTLLGSLPVLPALSWGNDFRWVSYTPREWGLSLLSPKRSLLKLQRAVFLVFQD